MSSRNKLQGLVVAGFSLLGLAFVAILFASLGTQTPAKDSGVFASISPGETVKLRLAGEYVWVTHLTQFQQTTLGELNPCAGLDYCTISAAGAQSGIDLIFSKAEPAKLAANQVWIGGFVDPTSGAVFDLAGRTLTPDSAAPREVIKP